MLKPDVYGKMGQVIDEIYRNGLVINKLKMSRFSRETASVFYKEHTEKSFFPNLSEFMTSDVVVGMELIAESAVQKWRAVLGPTNTQKAQNEAPDSIRAKFGTDGTKNACHGADSAGSYKREVDFFFGGEDTERRPMQTTAVLNNCTLCLIKPHILKEGAVG